MAVVRAAGLVSPDAVDLDALVVERLAKPFALFFVTPEGEDFPDGTMSESGFAIDHDGRIFAFWTTWDAERGGPMLETWEQVEAEQLWLDDAEYRHAREAVGLG